MPPHLVVPELEQQGLAALRELVDRLLLDGAAICGLAGRSLRTTRRREPAHCRWGGRASDTARLLTSTHTGSGGDDSARRNRRVSLSDRRTRDRLIERISFAKNGVKRRLSASVLITIRRPSTFILNFRCLINSNYHQPS